MPKLTSLSLPSHSLSLKLKPPKMAASLTVSRLLTAPKSLSFSTTTAAAPPKTSLFSPKSFSSKSSYTPLPLKHSPHPKPLLRFSTTAAKPISAAIAVGDKLPEATLGYLDAAGDVQTVTVSELTKSKKAVLFAVPGAFTPTCSQKHVPGFVEKSGELKAKGVETIACIAVNDVFVLKAWKENLNIGDEVLLLSDGNGDFTRAIGAELDLSDKPVGLGVRSRRYSLLAEDGVVKVLNLEEGGAFTSSGAEDILKVL